MWIPPCILLTLFLSFVTAETKAPESLRMVHYLFRHGDRTPMETYNGDPNPVNITWPKGFGQLTTVGMRQHYKLGQWFRKRYNGFISKIYYNKEVHIRATDVDRTLMSAYSHLAGLYPPHGEDVWNEAFPWQPIPVHTIPTDLDFVLRSDACPRKQYLRSQVFNLPYFTQVSERYGAFMNWVSTQVGKKHDLTDIYTIADTLYIERLKKLRLPTWANDSVIDDLQFLDMVNFKSLAYTKELQRVQGGAGPLVKDLIGRLKAKIAGKLDPDLKLYIYSAHDSTVGSFLETIGAFNNLSPPYTATVIMELHEIDQQYFLQFSYKNDSSKEPYDLIVPGCSLRCPFEKFVKFTEPVISSNVEKECQTPGYFLGEDAQRVQIVIFASIAGVCVVIVLLQVAMISLLTRRNKKILYSRVDLNM